MRALVYKCPNPTCRVLTLTAEPLIRFRCPACSELTYDDLTLHWVDLPILEQEPEPKEEE